MKLAPTFHNNESKASFPFVFNLLTFSKISCPINGRKCFSPSRNQKEVLKTRCSKNTNPKQDSEDNNRSDKSSKDWDKAWSNFKKQGKKSFFSGFSPNKYVTWNPKRSEYPLSEEIDPIKKLERSNLMLWTSPKFTLIGAIVIVSFLLVYTILVPVK